MSSETNALQETENASLVVFPNPAHDRVCIEGIEFSEVQVYNAFGRLVKAVYNKNEINLEGFSKGVYLLKISDKDGAMRVGRVAVQ